VEEVKAKERRNTLGDLIYFSILEKFMTLRVDMLAHPFGASAVGSPTLISRVVPKRIEYPNKRV
jgi:hypothetical protein